MDLREVLDRWSPASSPQQAPAARPSGISIMAQDGGTILTVDDLAAMMRAGVETGSGVPVNEESALKVAAVFRCTSLISGAIATMPLHIKRRVDERTRLDASDNPLWGLLRKKPNPWQTPSQFRRYMQKSVLLREGGYARKVMSRGQVVALIPLHPDRVRVEQADDFTLLFRYTNKRGGQITIPQAEMFHLVGMPKSDGYTGHSVLGAAREAIGLSLAAERHGAALFKNGTNIAGILTAPKALGDEVIERLKTSLENFRGPGNAGKNLVLEEDLKYEPMGMSQEDAQFVQSREFQAQDIAMFFGVPPTMIGLTSKSTSWGTGVEQQSLGFVAYSLEDWLTTWEETIARDLIGENQPDLYARFNRKALVRGDIKTRFGAYAQARQWSLYTINELRALEDENPIEGGDTLFAPGNANGAAPVSGKPADDNGDPNDDPTD